jgi:hypothetical protein
VFVTPLRNSKTDARAKEAVSEPAAVARSEGVVRFSTDGQAVEEDLATIWVNATDRQDVTSAANLIDQILKRDPLSAGEAREGYTRIVSRSRRRKGTRLRMSPFLPATKLAPYPFYARDNCIGRLRLRPSISELVVRFQSNQIEPQTASPSYGAKTKPRPRRQTIAVP